MNKIITISLFLIFINTSLAAAGELTDWVQAFGYAVAAHEGGHVMAGEDVGVDTGMMFDEGGQHYTTNLSYRFKSSNSCWYCSRVISLRA